MLNRVRLLLRLAFKRPFFAASSTNKKGYRKDLWVFFLVFGILIFYSIFIVYGLNSLGSLKSAPAMLFLSASLMVFFFGFQMAPGMLFDHKDYESLMALPFTSGDILASRFIRLLLVLGSFSIAWLLPGTITYWVLSGVNPGVWKSIIVTLLSLPLTSLIPLTLAGVISSLFISLTAKMKHKNLIGSLLSIIFIVAISVIPAVFSQIAASDPGFEESLGNSLGLAASYYFPLRFFALAITGDWLNFLYLLLSSAAIFEAFVFIVSIFFARISTAMVASYGKRDFVNCEEKRTGVLKTLLKRELRGYFSSRAYVLNTMLSGLLFVIFTFVFYYSFRGEEGATVAMTASLWPFVGSLFLSLGVTTTVSFSLEGKRYWILESLPIPSKQVYIAKILLSLAIGLPFYIVGVVVSNIVYPFAVADRVYMAIVPLLSLINLTFIGLWIGAKKANFDYQNETAAVKQNSAVLIVTLLALFFAFVGSVLRFAPEPYQSVSIIALLLFQTGLGVFSLAKIFKTDLRQIGAK